MRASPAVEVVVCRSEWWRLGVAAVSVAGLIVAGLWAHGESSHLGIGAMMPLWVVLMFVTAAASTCVSLRPTLLRWDGECWRVSEGAVSGSAITGGDAATGRLEVAIDLGAWMLLRFWPDESRPLHRRSRWLPVQRRGLERQWHALRCAVYSGAPRATPTVSPEL